jgi:thiol-disulfide isomerase/thioredoxin
MHSRVFPAPIRTDSKGNHPMRIFAFCRYAILASLLLTCSTGSVAPAQDSSQGTFIQDFQKRIAEKDVDGALQLLEETTDLKPEQLAQFRITVGSLLFREKRPDEAVAQVNKALEATFEKLEDGSNPRLFASALPMGSMLLRQINPAAANEWIEKGLTTLGTKLASDKLSDAHGVHAQIMRIKLSTPDQEASEQARNKLTKFVDDCEKIYAGESDPSNNAKTMLSLWSDLLPVAEDANAGQLFDKIESLAQSQLKQSPTSPVLQAYTTAVMSFVSRNARTTPDAAAESLASATAFIDAIESDDATFNRVREGFAKNSERLNKTIQSARALLAMIGKPAPAIDPMEWVNGEPETLDSLKGKVVLLDFWAVWCGPCIATFPHLKHLDAEYGPKGLTIMGVTRQYNFSWDEETANAARAPDPVSLEDELAMLEKFIAKHELKHRTIVTPQDSKMQSEYQVTGIPHVALLDKQGNVRLVKIGSGNKNAEEIEAMVQTLLAE